jgi:hypothetical protein
MTAQRKRALEQAGNASLEGTPSGIERRRRGEAQLDIDRGSLFGTHPVVTRGFKAPTPPIKRCGEIVAQLIATGGSGCSFAAYPRFGKTYASEYLNAKLAEAFPTLSIVLFNAHYSKRPHAALFYSDLLEQSGFGAVNPARKSDMRQRVARAWWVMASSRQSMQLAFIGDEMQKLSPDEYSWLIDLMNDLHKMKVRVVGILFGQPELASLRSVLRESHRGDILGRFMSRFYAFEGISSAAELLEVMECYDNPEQFEYPKGSCCSFTGFFLPQAYARGWRLASGAQDLWQSFKEEASTRLSSPSKVQKLSVGMEWVAGALQYVLTTYVDFDRIQFSLSREHWRDAVRSSGFGDSLGLTYEPE